LTADGTVGSIRGSLDLEAVWQKSTHPKMSPFFERTSRRRKGFPSETQVKKGMRIVHGTKELPERLGRNEAPKELLE
jgi:hypothetical protein